LFFFFFLCFCFAGDETEGPVHGGQITELYSYLLIIFLIWLSFVMWNKIYLLAATFPLELGDGTLPFFIHLKKNWFSEP
jgi:hypothetical protein